MSIFGKQISQIASADLQELFADGAVETIQLEFKAEPPGKDETLKKLSSFANTYGGYLVVGAAADTNGKLESLSGVDPQSGYKQRIVQWCFDSLAPPVTPFVSDAIRTPGDPAKVCYVVYVPESAETPHFISGRRGCYIRTDEFSQRFEPRLAAYEEIRFLADRRQDAISRRSRLFARSEDRFEAAVRLDYASTSGVVGEIGTTLKCAVSPKYPHRALVDQPTLDEIIATRIIGRGATSFPRNEHERVHQHESVVVPNACRGFSMLDATTWGHCYYAVELEQIRRTDEGEQRVVRMVQLAGNLLTFLRHAGEYLEALGYDGSIDVTLKLERMRRRWFVMPERQNYIADPWYRHPSSVYDDAVMASLDTSSDTLLNSVDAVLAELLAIVGFAVNCPEVTDPDTLRHAIASAHQYSQWPVPG